MAKDYFQDIVPPSASRSQGSKAKPAKARVSQIAAKKQSRPPAPPPVDIDDDTDEDTVETAQPVSYDSQEETPEAPRGIRSININPTRPTRSRIDGPDSREYPTLTMRTGAQPRQRSKKSHRWLWIMAAACVVILIGIALVALRPTTVTVTPREQAIVFDQSSQFVAYPAATAASGTLPYTVQSTTLSAFESVAGEGATHVDSKASGSITVYNNYSASSVKLVANTRFESANGLIFRTPATIVVPGKSGSAPGTVTVTVVADQAGPSYNIGAAKFTVPGLKTTPAMYSGIYAQSSAAMSGGFSGTQTGVSDTQRAAAVADLRAQLQTQAIQFASSQQGASTTAFASLAQITYQDMPDTQSGSTSVQINESATVNVPVFPSDLFDSTVAFIENIDTGNSPTTLVPGDGYAAQLSSASSTDYGSDPIDFALVGNAQLVWQIDQSQLQQALAGKSQSAFQAIIASFPSIETAHARIEPFWSQTFPSNPSSIRIDVLPPQNATSTASAPGANPGQ